MKNSNKNKICGGLKKTYAAVSATISMLIFNAITASAAAEGNAGFDTAALTDGIKTGLIAVISIIGAGMAVFGVIHLVQAQGEQDPNAKTNAIKQLSAGIGMIIVGAIVIPIFTNAINFG